MEDYKTKPNRLIQISKAITRLEKTMNDHLD